MLFAQVPYSPSAGGPGASDGKARTFKDVCSDFNNQVVDARCLIHAQSQVWLYCMHAPFAYMHC